MTGPWLRRGRLPLWRQGGHGVTAVELVTVVALLLIMAAIAVPSIGPLVLRTRLRGAAWQVAGDLRLVRQRAVTVKKRFQFCVTGCAVPVPPGSYSLEREDGALGSGNWVNENGVATRLPPEVAVTANATPKFTITGTASGATVTLSNFVGVYNVVVAPSGRVQVCEGACP
jgi:Tfp pilus assembly protein FimT